MENLNKYTYYYFLILFSFIPLAIIIGSSISVVNILLIDLSFVILLFFKKNFNFLKKKVFLFLLFLYLYLILNSFIAIDYNLSLLRNFGFIRVIILFLAFNYFFYQKLFFDKMIKAWAITLLVVVFDVFVEYFFGKNIIGYGGEIYGNRIVSFFKDEPIVGGYILGFFLLIGGFFMDLSKNKHLKKILFFILLILISIILTGERSNSIKSILALILFVLFINNINIKKKLLFFFSLIFIILLTIYNSEYLKFRYTNQLFSKVDKSITENIKETLYYRHYISGINVFKNNFLFGVGNKNYRVETCNKVNNLNSQQNKYICSTHPHNIYFEFLSEHGLVGTFILLFIFYRIIIKRFLNSYFEINYLVKGSFINLIIHFLPILPSGAFFTNYNLTIFIINLSIFYASSKNNVFKINKQET
jgi:O-antigen ligase